MQPISAPLPDIRRDPAAFEALYRSASGPCRRFVGSAFRRLRDAWRIPAEDYDEAAEDAVREAFAIARDRWDTFDPARASITTWLNAIAVKRMRRILDYWMRHAVHRAPTDAERSMTLEQNALLLRHAVTQTLRGLKPTQAQALVLHYLEDVPVREVAARLHTSEIAVQSLLQRGRASFRRAWETEPATPRGS